MNLAEKVSGLLGKKLTIEELLTEFYGSLDGFREVPIRHVGDLVKFQNVPVGIYLGNGLILTAEKDGVCTVPAFDGLTYWRR